MLFDLFSQGNSGPQEPLPACGAVFSDLLFSCVCSFYLALSPYWGIGDLRPFYASCRILRKSRPRRENAAFPQANTACSVSGSRGAIQSLDDTEFSDLTVSMSRDAQRQEHAGRTALLVRNVKERLGHGGSPKDEQGRRLHTQVILPLSAPVVVDIWLQFRLQLLRRTRGKLHLHEVVFDSVQADLRVGGELSVPPRGVGILAMQVPRDVEFEARRFLPGVLREERDYRVYIVVMRQFFGGVSQLRAQEFTVPSERAAPLFQGMMVRSSVPVADEPDGQVAEGDTPSLRPP